MLEKAKNWLIPRASGRGSLRWGFIAAYLGVLGTVMVYFNLIPSRETTPALSNAWGMTVLLLLLLGVERYEAGQTHTSRRVAMVLVLVRMALVEAAVTLDSSRLSLILYPVIPFAAYFACWIKSEVCFDCLNFTFVYALT